ncbi:MAG TPA: FlgD immunoglobulin-like domain containing protein [Ignavibacteriaceae bacterium]|nr:FlgD immunoglobulin-like domain containing protein [Ignavibacteriaceae bacterium]
MKYLLYVRFLLLLIIIVLLSQNSFGQNKNFVGKKVVREGNKSAIQTVPELNKSKIQSVNNQINTKPESSGPDYVLGGSVIWQAQDGLAIANFTKLNGDGSIPVVGWGLNNMRVSRYGSVNNTPLWNYTTAPYDPGTDVAHGIITVSKGNEFLVLDSAETVLFQYSLPDSLYANFSAVSRDGSQAIFLAQAFGIGNTGVIYSVNLTGTPSINWMYTVNYNQIGNWTGAAFSASGNRIVVNGRYRIYVFNPSDGALIWSGILDNSEAPSAISGDGNILATADNNGFVQTWLFNGSNEYNILWQFHVPAGTYTNWASSVAISADGSTVLAGSLIFLGATYDGGVYAFDTFGDGSPKWIYLGLGDLVDDVALSDDGKVAAVSTWGDYYDQSKPDLLVFDVETGDLTYSLATPGSFFTVDISYDGSKVFGGGKAVHARDFGNGGRAYYVGIDLGGGNISGHVSLSGTSDYSGVVVNAVGTPRTALTNSSGDYTILNVPAGTYTVMARKPGYNFGSVSNVVVTDGNTTSGVDFSLTAFASGAPTLMASNNSNGDILLSWTTVFDRERLKFENAKATGDEYQEIDVNASQVKSMKGELQKKALNKKEDKYSSPLLADSIAIYRSTLDGGPYTRLISIPAAQNSYVDTGALALTTYYYVATLFNGTGESEYSDQVEGAINDSLLTFSIVAPLATVPTVDGVISPGEWDDAVKIDVSDVLGFGSGPKPRGSAFMYFKYDDQTKMLYVASEDLLNPTLDDGEGIGLYFDDNNNDDFETQFADPIFQEGNFWAYWHPGGSDLRFRQIFKGGGVGTVTYLNGAQVDFSDGAGYVQGEVAIPMDFINGNDLQVYGPDNKVGLGAFLRAYNAGISTFNGWWPQTMHSLFIPHYFGDVKVNIILPAPPQSPANISVDKQDNNLLLSWTDPTLGLNNYPLPSPPTMDVFKNGEFLSSYGTGVQSVLDDNVGCGQWYQYALDAYIVDGTDTMRSPVSLPVGNFACFDPTLTPITYDDSAWNYFAIVSVNSDDNKFGVRFTAPFYPTRVIKLATTVNSNAYFDFTIQRDSAGVPSGPILAGPYRVRSTSPNQVSIANLIVPGDDPPVITSGDFWVIVNYLPDSPLSPGIGVDSDPPYANRSMYYTRTEGWVPIINSDLMVTAFVTDTVTSIPVELTSFTATLHGNNVTLNWTVASQLNNKGFEIERKSDNSNFQSISFIKGDGTTTEQKSYSYVDKDLKNGDYSYRLKQIDFNGTVQYSQVIQASVNTPVVYNLSQNYPNPFNPSTQISYQLPEPQMVTLEIYNSLGEKIRTLVNEKQSVGYHTIQWKGDNNSGNSVASGMYLYRITAGKFTSVKKMLLLR